MVINVSVDLSDFYNQDEDQSFKEQLKEDIAYRVRDIVIKDFREKGLELVRQSVADHFNKNFEQEIKEAVKKVFTQNLIKDGKTYEDYIIERIKGTNFYNETGEIQKYVSNTIRGLSEKTETDIKKQFTELSDDLKKRYDLLFASQIVSKLHESGMLKEDVAKILLG